MKMLLVELSIKNNLVKTAQLLTQQKVYLKTFENFVYKMNPVK